MMINKIMNELGKRLAESTDGSIVIRMKKSGDAVIITPDDTEDSLHAVFELRGFKLRPVYAFGLYGLADEIMRYDQTVERQQRLIADLYAFYLEKIDTGLASETEKQQYSDLYSSLFGYRPDMRAAASA